MYNKVTAIRGFKTKLKEGDAEVDGYLIGITGESLEKLEKLKEHFHFKEEQDVISLAISLVEKVLVEQRGMPNGKK